MESSATPVGTVTLSSEKGRWLWERLSHPVTIRWLEIGSVVLLAAMALLTYLVIEGGIEDAPLSPPVAASLLIANLLPAIVLIVLLGRRLALRRAAESSIGSKGLLHVRLVAMFSLIASIPVLLVVIFSSLLFQYGVEFWFSDRARGMLENASELARGYYDENLREVGDETLTMAQDLRSYLGQARIDSPEFAEGYVYQILSRKLNESAIIELGEDGVPRTAAVVDPGETEITQRLDPTLYQRLLGDENLIVTARADRIEAITVFDRANRVFLYASRDSDLPSFSQWQRAQTVLADYNQLFERSRRVQLQFNIALFFGALLIIGAAVWIALFVADRLVRPVAQLVHAAQQVTEGDLKARVVSHPTNSDELGILGRAFNRMTERLEQQTGALVDANSQLESRRAFIETVLESVTAGIVSLDEEGIVRLSNSSADAMFAPEGGSLIGQPLSDFAPELMQLVERGRDQEVIQIGSGPEPRTFAVKAVAGVHGHVITFEDITQQLVDQRRAAWADVARRIAHEIKNPLTPIQLAAERLNRRFSKEVEDEEGTFGQLTGTIVRQVGDLRKIVDEFSSFARMPKPTFRQENLTDILRHSLLLHEVAHPEIAFGMEGAKDHVGLVCDRRQLAQALTNIIKNAVEAIETRAETEDGFDKADGTVRLRVLKDDKAETVTIIVRDNGIGLPKDRDRIVEPYVTARSGGTGLGLAIVKKIVEEHFGQISFEDVDGGGARVTLCFDVTTLEGLAAPGDGDSDAKKEKV